MTDDTGYLDRWHLQSIADRCERGAELLNHEADNAEAVLAQRAGGHTITPDEWAAQKRSAAAAATAYATQLRDEAAAMGPDDRIDFDRGVTADLVATASELGGILMDRRPAAVAALDRAPDYAPVREMRAADVEAEQRRAEQLEATGVFEHVAETIGGVEQVPFWRLSGPTAQDEDAGPDFASTPYGAGRRDWSQGRIDQAAALNPDSGTAYRQGLQDERTARVDDELATGASDAYVDFSGPGGDHDLRSSEDFDNQWPETKNFADLTAEDHAYLEAKYPEMYADEDDDGM